MVEGHSPARNVNKFSASRSWCKTHLNGEMVFHIAVSIFIVLRNGINLLKLAPNGFLIAFCPEQQGQIHQEAWNRNGKCSFGIQSSPSAFCHLSCHKFCLQIVKQWKWEYTRRPGNPYVHKLKTEQTQLATSETALRRERWCIGNTTTCASCCSSVVFVCVGASVCVWNYMN